MKIVYNYFKKGMVIIIAMFSQYMAKNICNKVERPSEWEVIAYSIEVVVKSVIKLSTILLIGVTFNILLELFLALMAFATLRITTGGYHFKKFFSCYVITNLLLVSVIVVARIISQLEKNFGIIIFVLLICLSILKGANPVINQSRPSFDNIHIFKKISYFIFLFWISVIFFMYLTHKEIYALGIGLSLLSQCLLLIFEERRLKYVQYSVYNFKNNREV